MLLLGCTRPSTVRPTPLPTAEQLLAHLRARAQRTLTVRTEAKVDYLAERGERIKLSMTFLTSRHPVGVRIDAENPLGGTVASLATDAERFELHDSRQNRFLSGEATPCNLARLLRVWVQPTDLIEILTGGAPLLGNSATVGWDSRDGGRDVLKLSDNGLQETIRFLPEVWDVASVEMAGADGKLIYRVVHEDFGDEAGFRFPGKSWIFDPEHHADAKIRYRARDLAPIASADAFRLVPPPGIPVETVRCSE